MSTKNNIVLLGAYGFTALKIARLLNKHKIEFIAAGRNHSKLEALQKEFPIVKEIFQVDIESDDDLDKMLGDLLT